MKLPGKNRKNNDKEQTKPILKPQWPINLYYKQLLVHTKMEVIREPEVIQGIIDRIKTL